MKSVDFSIHELNNVSNIVLSVIKAFKSIEDANKAHTNDIIKSLNKNKSQLSCVEEIVQDILTNEKERCEVKLSFLNSIFIKSLEELAYKNKEDLALFISKSKELQKEDNEYASKIKKLNNNSKQSFQDSCKIYGVLSKRKELYSKKKLDYDEFFSSISCTINQTYRAVNEHLQRYITFDSQLKTKSIDLIDFFCNFGEDNLTNANTYNRITEEELKDTENLKDAILYETKIEVRTYLGNYNRGVAFLFPYKLLIAFFDENSNKSFLDITNHTVIKEITPCNYFYKQKTTKSLSLVKKKRNFIEQLFSLSSLEIIFESGNSRDEFVRLTSQLKNN